MRNGTPPIASLRRTLATLEAIILDGGHSNVSAIARSLGMPVATAHRQVTTLVAEGYLKATTGGRHIAGARLLSLLQRVDEKQLIANAAAPVLHRLAMRIGCVVQLGTFESDMVTYRIKTGHGAKALFTKVGMQLEAYCSGMGKVLLAHLPDDQLRAYLAAGPFVALTANTITDPARLGEELGHVRTTGYAIDDGEIVEGLFCIAVPVHAPDDSVPAAVSVSQMDEPARCKPLERNLPQLFAAAAEIEALAFVRGVI
jgi:DNA-binding IclR family transcriptional regulator